MVPYEALYGRKCRSPICQVEVGDRPLLGLELVQETIGKVNLIRQWLKTAQSRQKSYADVHRREREYEVGNQVFIKVTPMKGHTFFGVKGKESLLDPQQIVEPTQVPINDDYTYAEQPLQIVSCRIKKLRNKEIPLVKVDWHATWEREEDMEAKYPEMFSLDLVLFAEEGT
ncbi:uncharacterized protein LOC114300335 [Camellia sinensis]|uniref:uncharacterized protein LOC114300335 n=1 Tax=Camellia sinensis TaxID=4442 RepID=UPI0010357792|nr:uncharacterized protein LOC114300335 [Camellia sinensis]